ncbi:MAG: CHY zinc finger protein [Pyrinomonadaceae bacterium]
MRKIHGERVFGIDVDDETRCAHWHSELDIIAIKFKCCGKWYPCFECHAEIADHKAGVWLKSEHNTKAILCGACGHQLTIREYLNSESKCTKCGEAFNPNCAKHYALYFEL